MNCEPNPICFLHFFPYSDANLCHSDANCSHRAEKRFPAAPQGLTSSLHRYWCESKTLRKMDENVKKDEKKVMLVREAEEGKQGKQGKLKAVTKMDDAGNAKTADPQETDLPKLFDVNTNEPALEAFFRKFMGTSQDPVKTGISEIFIMAESVLEKLIKIELDPQLLSNYRVDPTAELSKMEQHHSEGPRFEPMDVSKIDMDDMARKGIRMEDMEPYLRAMSYGHKSNGLIEMHPEMEQGGMRVTTKGRVSLEEQADGTLKVVPHYYREKCDLDSPFHGVLLDDEAKRNIEATRHAGKVIDLELEPGKMTPCYISRDKWTNELIHMPVSQLDKRDMIKNAALSEGKQLDLYSGGKVLLEGYTTRSGYLRDAYIQVDAAERNFEFDHNGFDRRRYQDNNQDVYRQKRAEQGNPLPDGPRPMFIPKRVFGVEIPQETYAQWQEALSIPEKRPEVKAIYMRGLKFQGEQEPQDRWVKPDFEAGKIRPYKWNPDYTRKTVQTPSPRQTQTESHPAQTPQPKQEQRTTHQPPAKPRQNKSKGVGGV